MMQSSTGKQAMATNSVGSGISRAISDFLGATPRYSLPFLKDYLIMGIFSAKCTSTARLDGKTAVITGCNTGIGKCTAKDFFLRGAKVIMACRNTEAANEALNDIRKECENCTNCGELKVTELNLANLESVRKCAEHLMNTENKINILVNNAGLMMCPNLKTDDGFELQFGTNHLGHFLFTSLLLPRIIESKPARIVTVSSLAHVGGKIDFDDLNWEKKTYSPLKAYEQSKLANVLFSKELDRRLKEAKIEGVNTYSLHPGVIATDLGRHLHSYIPGLGWLWNNLIKKFIKTPQQGAQTTIYCAVDEKCENESGLYYSDCKVKQPQNDDDETAKKLWEVSLELVKLENFDPFQKK